MGSDKDTFKSYKSVRSKSIVVLVGNSMLILDSLVSI